MKILKYILLLLLLLSIAFFVFVSTQKSEYKIVRIKEIPIATEKIYNFINDSATFQFWNPWTENEAQFQEAIKVQNKNIRQNIIIKSNSTKSNITFTKTRIGTTIKWELSGKLDFEMKLNTLLHGGLESYIGEKLSEGLENIENYLVHELTNHSIKIKGVETIPASGYLQIKTTYIPSEFQTLYKKQLLKLKQFALDNQLSINGLPFISYQKNNIFKENIFFTINLPIKEEILTEANSEIIGGFYEEFKAVKTVLKGDYAHKKEAWKTSFLYFEEENIQEDSDGIYFEIYKVTPLNEIKPSKWETELYIPIKRKIKIYRPKPKVTSVLIETSPIPPTNDLPVE